jgi:hypothetical protein
VSLDCMIAGEAFNALAMALLCRRMYGNMWHNPI